VNVLVHVTPHIPEDDLLMMSVLFIGFSLSVDVAAGANDWGH
jgi:hypothetical protein